MPLEDLFEQVKAHYEIVEFISNYVRLKKVGRNYIGFCPFHSEKVPSFVVSPEKQIFKCFGCGAGGDVIAFYMKIKGSSYKEALLELAEKAGIEVDKKVFKERKKTQELVELNYKIAKFYHNLLYFHSESQKAKEYLKERGISENTIKEFLIGFAPDEGRVLASYLRSSERDFSKIEKTGLVRKNTDGSFIDLFRSRIIFPIFNIKGECVGFGGRSLDPDIEPKYLNTPETRIYKKSEILYGLYQAKEFIKKEKEGILVEGYFDFLSLWEHGIKNVVATCGTALTEKHVKILRSFTENWIIFYDGDSAGKKATLRAISLFLKEGIIPQCVMISEEDDPDSWVRKVNLKGEELKNEIKKYLMDAIPFVMKCYEKEYLKNPSSVFKEIIEIFSSVEDPLLKNKIARDLSFHLNISETDILKSLSTFKTKSFSLVKENSSENSLKSLSQSTKDDHSLRIIAQFLINYPEKLPELEETGLLELLREKEDSLYIRFLQTLIENIKNGNLIMDYVPDPKFQEILSDIILAPPFDEDIEEVLNQIKNYIINECKRIKLKKLIKNVKTLEIEGKKEEVEKYLWILKNSLHSKSL